MELTSGRSLGGKNEMVNSGVNPNMMKMCSKCIFLEQYIPICLIWVINWRKTKKDTKMKKNQHIK